MMEEFNSKWRRDSKAGTALRLGDKTSLVLTDEGWRVTTKGEVHSVAAAPIPSSLEEAITMADVFHPPEGWTYKEGHWLRDGWHVRPEQGGWYVYRLKDKAVERASVQEFASADRARRWAEVRFDRTGTNLRGPKPRAGRKSTCKLPDVRVTESEKAAAMDFLKELGLTYSQFVRASLRFARDNVTQYPLDEDDWCFLKDANGTPFFVQAINMDKEQLDAIRESSKRGSERSEERLPDAPKHQTPDQTTPSANPFMHVKGLWPTPLHDD
tara:strand:+ start:2899 stop:3705 length:807 start_codon:yes stop_codon:yes gene_type:complete